MQCPQTRCGTCRECGDAIRARDVLITYDAADGTARFAECPGCRAVVHPASE